MWSRASTAALAVACALVAVHALPPPTEFRAQFEAQTGLKIDITRDLTCMAASFESRHSHGVAAHACGKFRLRWMPVRGIAGLTVRGTDYIGGPHKWFGSEGVHMKVFEASYLDLYEQLPAAVTEAVAAAAAPVDPVYVTVALRHQERDSYFSDEMHEAMGVFGRAATVDRRNGAKPKTEAAVLAAVIRGFRKLFGTEWMPQLQRMFTAVQSHYAKSGKAVHFILTGYSLGGFFATLLNAHLGFALPTITFGACGAEDALTESYPAPATAANAALQWDATRTRPNATVNAVRTFNFFHHWDSVPQLDCQIGYVCGWVRRTRASNDTDADRDGKVDANMLHAEERAVDRDGDGDIDPDDELPTEEEGMTRHFEMVYGRADDDENVPLMHEWLEAPDMVPLCSGGGAYSHVFGSCTRESREWAERARAFHRWRRAYYRNDLMGRAKKADGSAGGDDDDDAARGLGGEDADGDGEEDGHEHESGHGRDDEHKHDDDDDHVWSFAKRDDEHDDDL